MQISQPTVMQWRVAAGYCWTDAVTSSSDADLIRVLVEAMPPPGAAASRRYNLFEKSPALYRLLADCPPTEEGVLAFAREFGSLGAFDVALRPDELAGAKAEPLSYWTRAISEIRQAVWIWDLLACNDHAAQKRELPKRVFWEVNEQGVYQAVYFDSHKHLPPTQTGTDDGYDRITSQFRENLARFDEGELGMPAKAFLCELVNRNLQHRVSPLLDPDSAPPLDFNAYGTDGKPLRNPVFAAIRWMPSTLLAASWWQLAKTVSGTTSQRLCPGCKEWFEFGRGDRFNKTYCSDACRKRVFQAKRDTARRLRREGKSVKAIITELGATPEQVKGWLANKGK